MGVIDDGTTDSFDDILRLFAVDWISIELDDQPDSILFAVALGFRLDLVVDVPQDLGFAVAGRRLHQVE